MKLNEAIQLIDSIINKIKYYPLTLTEEEMEALSIVNEYAKRKKKF